jgi:hypothetical protein
MAQGRGDLAARQLELTIESQLIETGIGQAWVTVLKQEAVCCAKELNGTLPTAPAIESPLSDAHKMESLAVCEPGAPPTSNIKVWLLIVGC